MRFKKLYIGIGVVLVTLLLVSVLINPLLIKAILAKYKSTSHFIPLETDSRIYYEASSKGNAISLASMLTSSQSIVEKSLGALFHEPVAVYICATQESFNEYVYLSKNVRGAVYWGKVFLSPGAFNRGSLERLMNHELTHYLFYTYLGERKSVTNIPLWFREGIAVYVANGGKEYTHLVGIKWLMPKREKDAFLSGGIDFWFSSDDPSDALTKNGTANGLFYGVGAAVVHFMQDQQPDGFEKLIEELLAGSKFDDALALSYMKDKDEILAEFAFYLRN